MSRFVSLQLPSIHWTFNRVLAMGVIVILTVLSVRAGHPLDLWLTKDQQGVLFYELGQFSKAAQRFENDEYMGRSLYANQDFIAARHQFEAIDSKEAYFYLGNAFAHEGKLPESIVAYQKALALSSNFEGAAFNLDYVQGLYALDEKEYEDAGGTGGKLKADKIVFDNKADDAVGQTSLARMQAQTESDEELRSMWMRRVQTTPGDFLAMKFQYQLLNQGSEQTIESSEEERTP